MEITNLKQMTKEEVFNLIRQRLSFGDELQQQLRHEDKDKFMKEHRRFEMSGFETQTGWCTVFSGTRERIPGCCIPDGIKSERPT